MKVSEQYKRTKTTKFMFQLNKFLFIVGLPNFWVEDLNFSQSFSKVYKRINAVGNIFLGILIISELGAFFTQHNLTNKQASDLFFYSISHSIVIFFRIRMAQQEPEIRDLLYKLGVGLKEVYNDLEVEKVMIKKSMYFSAALVLNCGLSVFFLFLEAWLRTIRTGDTFNVIITIIPDINDHSTTSNIIRVIYHVFWLIYVTRVFAVYTLVICLLTVTSHQFKNLNSYFWSLNETFTVDNGRTHKLREEAYEFAFKIGIKMHAESLNCTKQVQAICREVFSGQIIFNITLLILLMFQMVNSDRNPTNALAIVLAAATILFSTGLLMWNAGDITIEAEQLPTTMFCSGWENCYSDSSKRVRKLIIISMIRAQQPVVLTGFGIIPLSYQSYVSIVKSSYSVFSVVY